MPVSMMPSPAAVKVLIVTDTGSKEMGFMMYWTVKEKVLRAAMEEEKAFMMVRTLDVTVAELAEAVFVAKEHDKDELNNY